MLRPLKTKRATEVAYHLVQIFSLLGCPAVLQSDNGREFAARVIDELKGMWPGLNIVHGKPRNPRAQGSVERCNKDVKDMLTTWVHENGNKWSMGLNFVQFQKNCSHHR